MSWAQGDCVCVQARICSGLALLLLGKMFFGGFVDCFTVQLAGAVLVLSVYSVGIYCKLDCFDCLIFTRVFVCIRMRNVHHKNYKL